MPTIQQSTCNELSIPNRCKADALGFYVFFPSDYESNNRGKYLFLCWMGGQLIAGIILVFLSFVCLVFFFTPFSKPPAEVRLTGSRSTAAADGNSNISPHASLAGRFSRGCLHCTDRCSKRQKRRRRLGPS